MVHGTKTGMYASFMQLSLSSEV